MNHRLLFSSPSPPYIVGEIVRVDAFSENPAQPKLLPEVLDVLDTASFIYL